MISKIVRMGYLLQNFKCSIIQRRDPDAEENFMPEGGRPCKAEIRLYGATDAGLRERFVALQLHGLCLVRRHGVKSYLTW
jgi:hypothetical protein